MSMGTCPDCGEDFSMGFSHECPGPNRRPVVNVHVTAPQTPGWICPRCKTVNAPWVRKCECSE